MREKTVRLLVAIILSLGLVAAGLWILVAVDLSKNPELGAAASGWIGLVVGFWLR